MTHPTERKRLQRQRDKITGWAEVSIKVRADRVDELRSFAVSLGSPPPITSPDQMDLLEALDRLIAEASK